MVQYFKHDFSHVALRTDFENIRTITRVQLQESNLVRATRCDVLPSFSVVLLTSFRASVVAVVYVKNRFWLGVGRAQNSRDSIEMVMTE